MVDLRKITSRAEVTCVGIPTQLMRREMRAHIARWASPQRARLFRIDWHDRGRGINRFHYRRVKQ